MSRRLVHCPTAKGLLRTFLARSATHKTIHKLNHIWNQWLITGREPNVSQLHLSIWTFEWPREREREREKPLPDAFREGNRFKALEFVICERSINEVSLDFVGPRNAFFGHLEVCQLRFASKTLGANVENQPFELSSKLLGRCMLKIGNRNSVKNFNWNFSTLNLDSLLVLTKTF